MKTTTPHTNYKKTALFLGLLVGFIAILCLLWICLQGHTFLSSDRTPSQRTIADIYQNGTLLYSIPLDTVDAPYTITIVGENGCENEIEIRPGSIGVLSADCPDKLCVNQGFIHSTLLPITCLPNHLVIQLRTEDALQETEPTLDILTY